MAIVSDELFSERNHNQIKLTLSVVPVELWPQLQKITKIRLENLFFQSLEDAEYYPSKDNTNDPFCTWIYRRARYFEDKSKLRASIIKKLQDDDFDDHNFIACYLLGEMPHIFTEEEQIIKCVHGIASSVRAGNEYMKNELVDCINDLPDIWKDNFVDQLKDLTDPDHPELYLSTGEPFLGKFSPSSNPALPF